MASESGFIPVQHLVEAMYPTARLKQFQEQLVRAANFDLYAAKFEEAGIEPAEVTTWDDVAAIPFTSGEDLAADIESHPPGGSLDPGASMLSFTPGDVGLSPVFDTEQDIKHLASVTADVFRRAGIEPGHRVVNAFGYHVFGAGYLLHRALTELGAEVIPLGPGNSEQTAGLIESFDVDALIGNPSFALKLADEGATVERFLGSGEPFTTVPGVRDQVKEGLGATTAVDLFGTRRAPVIASETTEEDGLHVVDEYVLVEIVDPDTGERVKQGTRGEVVLSHMAKGGTPLVRYRTGDIASIETGDGSVILPNGIVGRTDNRVKVKGVKIYPESLQTVILGFPGLTGEYRLELTRPESTDYLAVVCEGEADVEALREALTDRLLVRPDEIRLVNDLPPGERVDDERY